MTEDIKLDVFPKEAGVYIFKVDNEVIYVGSSNNLYLRMVNHRSCIRKGWDHGRKQDLYQFLQSNPFVVEFQTTADYRQLEQELIEKYHPKYNSNNAKGLDIERKKKWQKEYEKSNKRKEYKKEYQKTDKYKEYNKEYQKSDKRIKYLNEHKEYHKEYQKEYQSQLCFYNDQILTLNALSLRFRRAGIDHPTLEAKKYLLNK